MRSRIGQYAVVGVLGAGLAAAAASCTSSSKKSEATASATAAPTVTPTCGGIGALCEVAGQAGNAGFSGDGGAALQALLYAPQDVFEDASGAVYLSDWNNYRFRRVDGAGTITTYIGSGLPLNSCDTTPAMTDMNHCPQIVLGPNNHFYIAGWHDHDVKEYDPATGPSGLVTCPVGVGIAGCSSIPGPAPSAVTGLTTSVDFDSAGNLYTFSQSCESLLQVTTAGWISVFAGPGDGSMGCTNSCAPTSVRFSVSNGTNAWPGGRLAIDRGLTPNVLYFADGNPPNTPPGACNLVRRVDLATGCVTTLAGTGAAGYSGDGAAAISAQLNAPMDVAVGPDHSLYIADTFNHVIRRVDYITGVITTVAGNGLGGSSPNGTAATQARLYWPCGVFVNAANVLYIADTFNHQIKKVKLS